MTRKNKKRSNTMRNTVHFIVQGKGGCGKSLVATILCQYIKDHLKTGLKAYDIDQVNTTLYHYKALDTTHISIVDDDNKFNERKFDNLIENIIETKVTSKDTNIVIDTGSNTFLQLLEYTQENEIFSLLLNLEFDVYLHLVLAGGDQFTDTLHGVKSVIEQINVSSIIWINEFFGPATAQLQSSQLSNKNYTYSSRIKGTVILPHRTEKTFGEDIKLLNKSRLTLNEALNSKDFGLMPRMRLKTVFNEIYGQLDAIETFLDKEGN